MIPAGSIAYRTVKSATQKAMDVTVAVRCVGYSLIHLVNREVTTRPDIPLPSRFWAYRHGFLSSSLPLYGLPDNDRALYLTQWESERAKTINGSAAIIHEDKRLFHYVLQPPFPDALPTLYGYLDDGRLSKTPFSPVRYDGLRDCVDDVGKLVVKPADGSLGNEVQVIERTDDGYQINGTPTTGRQLEHRSRTTQEAIVTEFVDQAPYAARIFPDASNTIRLMTMIDPDTDTPFVGALDHRFGTTQSSPVDNTAKGGVSASVDPTCGRLGKAVASPTDATLDTFSEHPETGAAIEGVDIPGWEQIHDGILELAAYLKPITPYVGWDVLVTGDHGSFVIVEGNSYPDVPLQVHEPLLADERVRSFYEYHQVIKR